MEKLDKIKLLNINDAKLLQLYLAVKPDGLIGMETIKSFLKEKLNIDEFSDEDMKNGTFRRWLINKFTTFELPHIPLISSLVGNVFETDIDGDGKGDNRGGYVDKFLKSVFPDKNFSDDEKGYAWCACFITWVMEKTYGYSFKSALAREWISHAREIGYKVNSISDLRIDTVFIGGWVKENGFGHVYFVDPLKSIVDFQSTKLVHTIEGNTNMKGSREGDGVYRKVRNLQNNQVYGIPLNKISEFKLK